MYAVSQHHCHGSIGMPVHTHAISQYHLMSTWAFLFTDMGLLSAILQWHGYACTHKSHVSVLSCWHICSYTFHVLHHHVTLWACLLTCMPCSRISGGGTGMPIHMHTVSQQHPLVVWACTCTNMCDSKSLTWVLGTEPEASARTHILNHQTISQPLNGVLLLLHIHFVYKHLANHLIRSLSRY